MALERGSAEYKALVNDIAEAVLTKRITLTGNSPEGEPYKGTTSLGQEAAFSAFRGYRERRIEDNTKKSLQILEENLLPQGEPPATPDTQPEGV